MSDPHVHDLAAAYALDALDDSERSTFERHLLMCHTCQEQVTEFRETAAKLGLGAAENPPSGLRPRVLAAVEHTRQSSPLAAPEPWPRLVQRRRAVAAAVAAAAAAAALTVSVIQLVDRGGVELEPEVAAVLTADDVRIEALAPHDGGTARSYVAPSTGRGVLVADLPPLGPDEDYQVWVWDETGPRSAGILRSDGGHSLIHLLENVRPRTRIAVTREPTGGVAAPSGPIIVGMRLG